MADVLQTYARISNSVICPFNEQRHPYASVTHVRNFPFPGLWGATLSTPFTLRIIK